MGAWEGDRSSLPFIFPGVVPIFPGVVPLTRAAGFSLLHSGSCPPMTLASAAHLAPSPRGGQHLGLALHHPPRPPATSPALPSRFPPHFSCPSRAPKKHHQPPNLPGGRDCPRMAPERLHRVSAPWVHILSAASSRLCVLWTPSRASASTLIIVMAATMRLSGEVQKCLKRNGHK